MSAEFVPPTVQEIENSWESLGADSVPEWAFAFAEKTFGGEAAMEVFVAYLVAGTLLVAVQGAFTFGFAVCQAAVARGYQVPDAVTR